MVRLCDILFSLLALSILLPIFLPVVAVLKFSGEGEIFYAQERIGISKTKFKLLKFATMLKNSPNLGTGTITLKNDPRVLPFGRLLRKTKINELPQLINVLLGDMSLIGPRPLTSENFSAYDENVQSIISQVRPGLSGIGSIVFRNEENLLSEAESSVEFYSSIIAPYKGQLELWFVQNMTLRNYFVLIFLTVFCVVTGRSSIVWTAFPNLPTPSDTLADKIRINHG